MPRHLRHGEPDVHPGGGHQKFLTEHPEKPFIMCEYSHAMGNSCGGITDYTEYAYEEPLYQGGFIWEYIDHGIAVTGPDGKLSFAYGGDFGDRPTDREFCIDGLILPDRRNTPQDGCGQGGLYAVQDHPDRDRSRGGKPYPLHRSERL
ncbi:MAG: glycoside hydrolase family 2 TIM barrel-domain containing protein [Faecalibacterium sp.]